MKSTARTLHLAFATLVPMLLGLSWGLVVALLLGSRRKGLNHMTTLLAWLAPRLAGTPVSQVGQRFSIDQPAIYIFNHQSGLDPIVLCAAIGGDVVAIGKRKWKHHPVIGPLLWFGETVFVDESVSDQNSNRSAERFRTIYKPAIDILKQGRSIAIAPEGTRNSDGVIGEFRLGAFRIAQLAQVPIVPVVIYHAGERLKARSTRLRPGPIEYEILEPVYPEAFATSIDVTAATIRTRYIHKLTGEKAQTLAGQTGYRSS
ncbi:MAG: lysophospholipid acyltransferase family protein [Ketobacteraceae bacterium]|nr:lysophospholipid acyltransferase family protein [Ketobacteraceae bacterium]